MKNKDLAFTNAKGGVGKSCTAVSLGAGLALNNKNFLLKIYVSKCTICCIAIGIGLCHLG